MKKQFLILWAGFSLTCIGGLGAQQGLMTTGGNISSASGSVSYSIGQVNYVPIKGEDGNITPGVQQAYDFTIVGIEDLDQEFSVRLFPNPTSDYVTLELKQGDKNFPTGTYSIHLFDMQGKCLYQQNINEETNTIPLNQYSEAMYLLQIWKNQAAVKSFELIKSN